jgi:hypothetical protein
MLSVCNARELRNGIRETWWCDEISQISFIRKVEEGELHGLSPRAVPTERPPLVGEVIRKVPLIIMAAAFEKRRGSNRVSPVTIHCTVC